MLEKLTQAQNWSKRISLKQKLNEYFVVSYQELWDPISKGFDNVIKAVKLALKDVWSSLKYTFNVSFSLDENKIKEVKRKRKDEKEKYAGEYSEVWESLVASNPDFSKVAFLASPSAYLAAYLTLNGGKHAIEIRKLINREVDDEKDNLATEEATGIRTHMLLGETKKYAVAKVLKELSEISNELNRLLGMTGSTMYEGVLGIRLVLEEASPNDAINVSTKEIIASKDFENNISKKIDSSGILKLKKEELNGYIETLNGPFEFIKLVQNAKNLEGIVSAYKNLGSSLLRIDDFDVSDFEQKIKDTAQENYSKIIKREDKIPEILKLAGIKLDINNVEEKERKKIILSAIVKLQTMKELERIKELVSNPEFLKSLELAKEEFIKSFTSDVDEKTLNIMKKNAPNDEYVKLMTSGIEAIRNVGLRK
jgi:hypothetical protein